MTNTRFYARRRINMINVASSCMYLVEYTYIATRIIISQQQKQSATNVFRVSKRPFHPHGCDTNAKMKAGTCRDNLIAKEPNVYDKLVFPRYMKSNTSIYFCDVDR